MIVNWKKLSKPLGLLSRRALTLGFLILFLSGVTGCGYHLRSPENIWSREKINKLYIYPLKNNTLKAGLEVPFTSALLQEYAKQGRVQLADRVEDADAVLTGSIDLAQSSVTSVSGATQLNQNSPTGTAPLPSNFIVASEYQATAGVTLYLKRRDGAVLWGKGFSRSRLYPGNNIAGDLGNTSVLINESRFQNALHDISLLIAADSYDTMMEAF